MISRDFWIDHQDAGRTYWPVPIAQIATTTRTHICTVGLVELRASEFDGDVHLRLRDGSATVVAERIPLIPVALPSPLSGLRVRVWGITRVDREHRWDEIHPIEWLEVLPARHQIGPLPPIACDEDWP